MKSRFLVLLPAFCMWQAGISAANAQTVSQQLAKCLTVFGMVERLECYDNLARSVAGNASAPARPGAPPSPAAAAAPPPRPNQAQPPADFGYAAGTPSRQTTPESFGSENIAKPPPASPVDSITSTVTSFSFTPQGHFILTLGNGQVWRQIEGDVGRPDLRAKHVRSVKISRGLFGSYNLSFSDQTGRFKVDRVR
ncbi:MAG TPA: hypothetical protein VMU31_00405 [Rhizomicrobium sp.]|nr:hypothetical protein [Rhizomicrobium sp.]